MAAQKGRPDIQKKIMAIFRRMTDSAGVRQQDMAKHGGCAPSAISRTINHGQMLHADAFCGALEAVGVDVCALIEEALGGRSFEGIPPVVAEFLLSVGRTWLSEEQWQAIYWSARVGAFSQDAKIGDIHDFLYSLAKKRGES